MTAEEDAKNIVGFAVAKLDVKPGDVVIVRPTDPQFYAEERMYFQQALDQYVEREELGFRFLVIVGDVDLSVVHTLDAAELEKAGSGGWPHEGRPGETVGSPEET